MHFVPMKNFNLIESFYKLIKNRPTVPRWIILILDVIICAGALLYAYFLRFNMVFAAIDPQSLIYPVLLVSALNLLFFRIFRTYEGIIRLSSVEEGTRCISAVFSTSFVLLISIGISAIFKLPYLVPSSVLIIYFFTASFLISGYRIGIKHLYHKSLKSKFTAENVLIFGKTINGALLKKAIESIAGRQYKVVGFIEDNDQLLGKLIDNVKIFSSENLKVIALKCNVKILFLATDDIDIKVKNEIVDFCLANNINVKVIPPAQKWVDGQLQTKQIKNLKIEDLLNRPSIKLPPEHLHEFLAGKRILVTGAAGSIGSEIVKQLAKIKVDLIILCDNRETGLYELQYQLQQLSIKKDKIVVRISDVRSHDSMESIFETYQPQIVFHAAAYKHVPLMEMHPSEAIKNNVMGTRIVADLSVMYRVEKFVFISTDKAINPTNVMGASKRIAEMYIGELQDNQMQIQRSHADRYYTDDDNHLVSQKETVFITTRFGNVLGSNGSVIPRFQKQIDIGGPLTVTHPDITRYFMTIPEACSLVLEAATMGHGGEIFVFDMGEPVKIVDLAEKMVKLAGLIPGKDINIEFSGLRPGEKLYEEVLNRSEEVIPTHHKKIMISKEKKHDKWTINSNIDYLTELALKNKNISVVKQMKVMVVEYKSKNSAYEKLDTIERPQLLAADDFNRSHLTTALQ